MTEPRRLPQPGSRRTGLWWAHPAGVLLAVVPVSVLLAISTSDAAFRLLYRSPKTVTSSQSLLFLLAGGVLLLGVLVTVSAGRDRDGRPWPGLTEAQLDVLARSATVCFRLTVLGYVAFGVAGLARGVTVEQLIGVLRQQDAYSSPLKDAFAPVAGITTLTQVGIAYVVIAGLLLAGGRTGVARRVTVVLALGMFRAFFLTERLAVLELVVPFVLLLALRRRERLGSRWLSAAPLLALPVLVVVFGAFEYSRSWVFFRTRTTSSFPAFVVDRLAGYYATAYNNGAVQLDHVDTVGRLPYGSLEAFWTAPGISQLDLYDRLSQGGGPGDYPALLKQYATPEFNNPGGLAVPLLDWGVPGGLVFLLLTGLLIGACYVGFRRGSTVGLLIYPVVFTGLLELPRYFYWTQGRLVPAVLALLVVAWALRRAERPPRVRPEVPVLAGPAEPRPQAVRT